MGTLIQRDLGGRVLHWDPESGRGFQLDPGADSRALELRTARMGLGEDRGQWVVQRSRRVLTLPESRSLWVPCPALRTSGGFPYRELPLSPGEWAFWEAINDSRSLAEIEGRVGRIRDAVHTLAAFETQAIQLWPRRVSPARLRHVEAPVRPDHERSSDQFDPHGQTTLGAYHDEIEDAETHFDDRETTVAHAMAPPHPGLAGVPYGSALRRALGERGFDTRSVVEVGCGTGELARDWGEGRYCRVDLSLNLLQAQRARAPWSTGVLADATALPLRSGSVRCLISNEVLADLSSSPTTTGWDNHGARAMVTEVARVLEPGGAAFLSEFGVIEGEVEQTRQLDHPEVAIVFGSLAKHARQQGLSAELLRLDDLLGVDLHAPQIARHSYAALRALFRARGLSLAARAWTPQSLELPWPIQGIEWTTLADEGPGPLITRFWALLLRR